MSNFGISFTAWPEMLAWPYLMLQGWLPYRDIGIAHSPLLLLDLVIFFKLFGIGVVQLKIYTWILIAINGCLVYFVAKQFWNKKIAYFSALLFLLLTIVYEGNGLWFDLALAPFAILLFYFLKLKNYLWTGIIFALGFLTKQTFIYFAIPVVIVMIKEHGIKFKFATKVKEWGNFALGFGIVTAIFLVTLGFLGILNDYYNWAVTFGILYLPNAVGQVSLPNLKQLIFALAPFTVLFLYPKSLIFLFAIVGSLGVYSRWELFHFQPALPFLAIALSIVILDNKNKLIKLVVVMSTILFLTVGIYRQFGIGTRFYEEDVKAVASLINSHQPPVSSLYVINYWDNLYALTNTQPPKPLIPYIPWYLDYNDNRELIINNLKSNPPDAIIIGERDSHFPDLYQFVDGFYSCSVVQKQVELCDIN